MNGAFYAMAALALALVILLGAVLFAPRCTSGSHTLKVGGMLLAGCER